ncbi:MAG: rane protein-like, partial [Proteobacteria bacterium]|nr:rane protein-like [Pseudomonadota bacterium]
MTWLQQYRINSFLRSSVWLPPLLGMVAALLLYPLTQWIDAVVGWKSVVSPDSARAVLAALASSMLTFIVFVFSILLLAVQLASAQLTPRIIALVSRNRIMKFSLTIFIFAFTYTLAALSRIDGPVPQISMWVSVYSCIASVAVFLYMIDHVGKALRPVSIMTRIGNIGQEVIRDVYPQLLPGAADMRADAAPVSGTAASRTFLSKRTGVVLAFDVAGLVELARRGDCIVEFVPQVGDFVTAGDPLFRLFCGGETITDRQLEHAVAFGPERTMEQDPEFAFRIIVDIASKALSPAINDPTTAVLALDQIHRLLREVANRQLDNGRICDDAGELRLTYRTPDWENIVGLAVTEIRQ